MFVFFWKCDVLETVEKVGVQCRAGRAKVARPPTGLSSSFPELGASCRSSTEHNNSPAHQIPQACTRFNNANTVRRKLFLEG